MIDLNSMHFIIQDLISNSLFALISYVGNRGFKAVRELLNKDDSLNKILSNGIQSVISEIDIDNTVMHESIESFLASHEIEMLVRQIYATQITETERKNLQSIQKEWRALLSLKLGIEERKISKFSENLFKLLLEACERVIDIAIENNDIKALDKKNSLRFRILIDEISSIKKNLELFTDSQKLDLEEIYAFEKNYRDQLLQRHGSIIPPYFDSVKKIPIDSLYVRSGFTKLPSKKNKEDKEFGFEDFLSVSYRSVILGNPGGGKSTLTQKICYDLAKRYDKRIISNRLVTPFLVILRDYATFKKDTNLSILHYLKTNTNSNYQVPVPDQAIEYILASGKALVIFDGLDELIDTSRRQEISGAIESFCTMYPSVPVIATSREVGYEQAPLDNELFDVFRIAPFDENQIKEYVNKWFNVETDLNKKEREKKVKSFLDESKIVPDLRSNPLMLALMCNIYRGENYIPRNRLDVYEKCAVMLFDRWDKSRGIKYQLPFEAHIKPTMMYLANWIYSDESLQSGVTDKKLINKSTEYLCPRRFEDEDEAREAAESFVEYCRGRAWVFTDVGSTKEGDRLYKFTHRTFLEYFTASYILRNNETPEKLSEFLLPKICKREWDVVAQLAFQHQSRQIEEAGDKLLVSLIEKSRSKNELERANCLLFGVRTLEFIVPSPKLVRIITSEVINFIISIGSNFLTKTKKIKIRTRKSDRQIRYQIRELISYLLLATNENRPVVKDQIVNQLTEIIIGDNKNDAIIGISTGLDLPITLRMHSMRHISPNNEPDEELIKYWETASNEIYSNITTRMCDLSPEDLIICKYSYYRGLVYFSDLVSWHGKQSVFQGYEHLVFQGFYYNSPISLLLHRLLYVPISDLQVDFNIDKNLTDFSDYYCDSGFNPSKAFSKHPDLDFAMNLKYYLDRSQDQEKFSKLDISPESIFAAQVLLGIALERSKNVKNIIHLIKNNKAPIFKEYIYYLLVSRYESSDSEKIQSEFERLSILPKHRQIIESWIKKEINYIDPD